MQDPEKNLSSVGEAPYSTALVALELLEAGWESEVPVHSAMAAARHFYAPDS
jgi:hypothetical protein